MKDRFQFLIDELGDELNLDLQIGADRSCGIDVDGRFTLQLEENDSPSELLVAANLYTLPPGRLRQQVFLDALHFHHIVPRVGTLGYLESTEQLCLFHRLPFPNLTGSRLAAFLEVFMDLAEAWMDNIDQGSTTAWVRGGLSPYLLGQELA